MGDEKRKSFIFYQDFAIYFQRLETDEERAALIMAVFEYADSGKIPEFCGAVGMAFEIIRQQLDRDNERYRDKCRKNREIALRREEWKRQQISSTATQKGTKKSAAHIQQDDENTRVFSIGEVIKQIYDAYPCHKGKAKGIECVLGFLKGRKIDGYGTVKFNHEQLYCAARHYAIECQNNGTEPAYMKQFSTFMNKPVIDYVEYARESGGYEKYMKSRYGEDWERLKFVYVK